MPDALSSQSAGFLNRVTLKKLAQPLAEATHLTETLDYTSN